MLGNVQNEPINLISILQHASRWHSQQEIVTNTVEGGIHRQTYAETFSRTTRLAAALATAGIQPGDCVATMAWNTHRHIESWYAISGMGAICHTVNPRLFPDQVEFIVNHAEDKLVFVDLTFVPLLAAVLAKTPSIRTVVIMTDSEHMPDTQGWDVKIYCYEDFLAAGDDTFAWPVLPEDTCSSLCYTSGTTGDPKGVTYTHRSNLLHAFSSMSAESAGMRSMDSMLMVVPMFHANAWGIAHSGPMSGCKLVLPGPHMDGKSLHTLMANENTNKAAAVPTVWNMLIGYLNESGVDLDMLTEVIIGGAAVPLSMIKEFRDKYSVDVIQGWGMTEMSPIGTVNRPKPFFADLDDDQQLALRAKQGCPVFGVDLKVIDDDGNAQPHDGKSAGRLMCKGPWIIERYYKAEQSALEDGWFDTGDIATIDEYGYMQITDRSKDVIKSGGEWISSVDLENAAVAHPAIAMAACIGAKHPRWDERPILLIELMDGAASPTQEEVCDLIAQTLAKWQLPEVVIEVDKIPLTATGKIDKKPLRAEFEDYFLD